MRSNLEELDFVSKKWDQGKLGRRRLREETEAHGLSRARSHSHQCAKSEVYDGAWASGRG